MNHFNTFPITLPIKKIIRENEFVKTYIFQHRLNSLPGQFVNLWIPRVDEKPISIAYDGGDEFWLTIFAVGPATKTLSDFREGDLVGIRGPFGTSFQYQDGDHLMLLGGGYGSAPLYNLAVQALNRGCTIDFIIGARSENYLIFVAPIRELEKKFPGKIQLHLATDDGSAGQKGYNTQILEKLLNDVQSGASGKKSRCCVMAVGPEMMMKRASDLAFAAGVRCQVSLERYMKCGFGVCGNCCVDDGGERMCTEGPVVDHLFARKTKDFGAYHRDKVGRKIKF
jgi:dihydroorotate dehydrogenase electron transfer subunit